MNGRGAKNKGKNFEREIAKLLSKEFNAEVYRVPCSGALPDWKGDIRTNSNSILKGFTFELKRQEKLGIWSAINQAKSQVRDDKDWGLIFTRNREGMNYLCCDLKVFINILKELEEFRREKIK